MVFFHSSISVFQHIEMPKSANSADPSLKLRQINQFHKNKRMPNPTSQLNIPACEQSRSAIIDVVILIAVVGACGVLLYPYAQILAHKSIELGEEIVDVVTEEITHSPLLFGCLGFSIFFSAMALVGIMLYIDRRCGKHGCRGLHNAPEFDIQVETEDCVKKSDLLEKTASKKGLFELHRDHHRELEAELKKMAPPNGRAVLIFRARCGCSVGRMEVPGPRKSRKVKK